MDRQTLIKKLSPAIEKATGKTADQVARDLASASIQELEAMLNRQIQRGLITPEPEPTAPLVDQAAIQKDIDDLERILIAREGQRRELVQREAQHAEFLAEQSVRDEPKKAQQLKYDRNVFLQFCKDYGISFCDANFNLAHQTLQDDFSKYSLAQAARDGRLDMAKATQAELNEWAREAAERREHFLRNQASPEELRATARQESELRRQEAVKQEDQRQLSIREQKDAAFGFPPLPEFAADGTKLDSKFFVRISNSDLGRFRNFVKKYGGSAITQALRQRV